MKNNHLLENLTGEFKDKNLEKIFRKFTFKAHESLLRCSLFTLTLLYLANALVDSLTVADSRTLLALLTIRLVTVSAVYLVILFTLRNGTLSQSHSRTNLVLSILITGFNLILPLRPETADTQLAVVMLVIFAIYLYIPNRISSLVTLCTYLSFGYLAGIFILNSAPPGRLLVASMALLIPNLIGYFTILRVSKLQRQQFYSLLTERKSTVQLKKEITEHRKLEEKLINHAQKDELTKLNNRRRFMELASQELDKSKDTRKPITVCILDIDFFKKINDTFGHLAGDKVLETIAILTKSELRNEDIIGRYGGEEFVMILPNTTIPEARHVAERIRLVISNHIFNLVGTKLNVTVTIGISLISHNPTSIEEALHKADLALYKGKQSGRNQVTIAA